MSNYISFQGHGESQFRVVHRTFVGVPPQLDETFNGVFSDCEQILFAKFPPSVPVDSFVGHPVDGDSGESATPATGARCR